MRTVLIVDDIDDNRTLLKVILRKSNWNILEASDGSQVLKIAIEKRPDVILMDYNMPFMNGVQACYALKNDLRVADIPVIIYTGLSMPEIHQEAIGAGAIEFLTKPIPPQVLIERVEAACESRQA